MHDVALDVSFQGIFGLGMRLVKPNVCLSGIGHTLIQSIIFQILRRTGEPPPALRLPRHPRQHPQPGARPLFPRGQLRTNLARPIRAEINEENVQDADDHDGGEDDALAGEAEVQVHREEVERAGGRVEGAQGTGRAGGHARL